MFNFSGVDYEHMTPHTGDQKSAAEATKAGLSAGFEDSQIQADANRRAGRRHGPTTTTSMTGIDNTPSPTYSMSARMAELRQGFDSVRSMIHRSPTDGGGRGAAIVGPSRSYRPLLGTDDASTPGKPSSGLRNDTNTNSSSSEGSTATGNGIDEKRTHAEDQEEEGSKPRRTLSSLLGALRRSLGFRQ